MPHAVDTSIQKVWQKKLPREICYFIFRQAVQKDAYCKWHRPINCLHTWFAILFTFVKVLPFLYVSLRTSIGPHKRQRFLPDSTLSPEHLILIVSFVILCLTYRSSVTDVTQF